MGVSLGGLASVLIRARRLAQELFKGRSCGGNRQGDVYQSFCQNPRNRGAERGESVFAHFKNRIESGFLRRAMAGRGNRGGT